MAPEERKKTSGTRASRPPNLCSARHRPTSSFRSKRATARSIQIKTMPIAEPCARCSTLLPYTRFARHMHDASSKVWPPDPERLVKIYSGLCNDGRACMRGDEASIVTVCARARAGVPWRRGPAACRKPATLSRAPRGHHVNHGKLAI